MACVAPFYAMGGASASPNGRTMRYGPADPHSRTQSSVSRSHTYTGAGGTAMDWMPYVTSLNLFGGSLNICFCGAGASTSVAGSVTVSDGSDGPVSGWSKVNVSSTGPVDWYASWPWYRCWNPRSPCDVALVTWARTGSGYGTAAHCIRYRVRGSSPPV